MAKKATTIAHEKSSGNVFADLGLPHPEQELLKARLTLQICRVIKARRVTQTQAGGILGIRQPQVSLVMRNRSGIFSVERLSVVFYEQTRSTTSRTTRPLQQQLDPKEPS